MESSTRGYNSAYGEDAPSFAQISAMQGKALLEFGTSWCGHCQAAQPAIHAAMLDQPNLLHIKVFDGKGKQPGRAFHVKLWPTLILLNNGKEVARLVRPVQADEVRQLLQNLV